MATAFKVMERLGWVTHHTHHTILSMTLNAVAMTSDPLSKLLMSVTIALSSNTRTAANLLNLDCEKEKKEGDE